jgi:ammonia channel protein AmtB
MTLPGIALFYGMVRRKRAQCDSLRGRYLRRRQPFGWFAVGYSLSFTPTKALR